MAATKPVVKKRTRSAQPKVALTQVGTDVLKGDQEQTHRQPDAVAHEDTIHRQPNTVANGEGLHRQPDRQPNGVAQNTKNIDIDRVYRVFEMNKKNVVITEIDMQYATLAVEVGISESDLVAALATTQTLGDACRVALEAKGL